jgi:uroporphyrinogen decarboxylase
MRQAGRYMPEYNATRRRAGSFLGLAKSPAYATEVTLQPVERFPLDAAILFSDILTVPDAMGLGLYFAEGEGPKFERPVRTEADVARLAAPDPHLELRYVTDAVREIRRALGGRLPLIGFSGSPFTLACYMVEGGGSDDFRLIKSMLYGRPDLLHALLRVNARAVADYLNAQIEAGAQVVQLFDTWAGILGPAEWREWVLPVHREIVSKVNRAEAPLILYASDAPHALDEMIASGAEVLSLDWRIDLGEAAARVGRRASLQGNLDPCALFAPRDAIFAMVRELARAAAPARGHVLNLGHGCLPDTPVEGVRTFLEAAKSLGPP